jgi:hypothetical protein
VLFYSRYIIVFTYINTLIYTYYIYDFLKFIGSKTKNQKNSFLLQTAILIFAFLLKLRDENII